jgi:hypothetical protein
VSFMGVFFLRKFGWGLSKSILLPSFPFFSFITCIIWGLLIALLVRAMIQWQHPHWIIRWIFGYFMGAYASNPAYGLLNEATIPPEYKARWNVVNNVPVIAFIIASALLAWGFSNH